MNQSPFQSAFNCSESTIETPGQCLNLFKVNNQDIWADFTHCSGVSVVNFEQVKAGCDTFN